MRGSSIKEKKNNEYLWITKGLSHFSDFRSLCDSPGGNGASGRNQYSSSATLFTSFSMALLMSFMTFWVWETKLFCLFS